VVVNNGSCPVKFDHHAFGLADTGPEIYREMRDQCPVAWTDAHGGYWVLTGYDVVSQVARDDAGYSSDHDIAGVRRGYDGILIPSTLFESGFMEQDPPESLKVRKILNPLFTNAVSAAMAPTFRAVAQRFIDEVIEGGRCDFIDDLATPIPAVALFDLIGIPSDEWASFALPPHALNCAQPGTAVYEAASQELYAATVRLRNVVAARMEAPDDGRSDVLGHLCRTRVDGEPLSEEEIFGAVFLLWTGGVNTTTVMLASTVEWLSRHPDERDRLAADPSKLASACDEFLRAFSPITAFARTSTRPQALGDQVIDEGDRVLMVWAAANRDPAVFEDPDTVRLDRSPARQCAFGLGSHRCIGAGVAKTMFVAVMAELLERMPDFRVVQEGVVPYDSIGVSLGYKSMPFRFTPGPRSAPGAR
jgi:cytochrome P450